MNLIVRLALILVGATRRSRLGLLDVSGISMRVWPNDLDIQMHMNNGRYLSLMDLGRIDLLIRSGFFREARRRGWFPLVGAATIEYRRPLRVFERYILTTKLLGWDDRWFYLEQRFVRNEKPVAIATVKAMIRSASGAVPTADAVNAIGFGSPSPALPKACTILAQPRNSSGSLLPNALSFGEDGLPKQVSR